jgi:hypothetical protein
LARTMRGTSMQPSFRKARYFGGVAIRGHLYAIGLRNREDLRAALKAIYKDARRAARHALAFLGQGGISPSRPSPAEARRFVVVQTSQVRAVMSSLEKAGLISPPPPSKSAPKTQEDLFPGPIDRPEGPKAPGSLARDYLPARRTDGHFPGRSATAGPDLFSTSAVVPDLRSGARPERRPPALSRNRRTSPSACSGRSRLPPKAAPLRRPSSPLKLWQELLDTLPSELRSAMSSLLDMEA